MSELRHQVALWIAGGMTPEEIAAVLGLEIEKLKALFARELEHGHAITRASLLMRLDGAENVAADKRLLDEIAPAAPLSAQGAEAHAQSRDRPRGVGKKEWLQANAAHADVGTPFDGLLGDPDLRGKLQ